MRPPWTPSRTSTCWIDTVVIISLFYPKVFNDLPLFAVPFSHFLLFFVLILKCFIEKIYLRWLGQRALPSTRQLLPTRARQFSQKSRVLINFPFFSKTFLNIYQIQTRSRTNFVGKKCGMMNTKQHDSTVAVTMWRPSLPCTLSQKAGINSAAATFPRDCSDRMKSRGWWVIMLSDRWPFGKYLIFDIWSLDCLLRYNDQVAATSAYGLLPYILAVTVAFSAPLWERLVFFFG